MDTPTKSLFNLPVPVMTRELFSTFSGLGEEVIRGLIEKGHIPSVKVGRHRMVNLALLTDEMMHEEWDK